MAGSAAGGEVHISNLDELRRWLNTLSSKERSWVVAAFLARASLRVAPLIALCASLERRNSLGELGRFVPPIALIAPRLKRNDLEMLAFSVLSSAALARVWVAYPARSKELDAASNAWGAAEGNSRAFIDAKLNVHDAALIYSLSYRGKRAEAIGVYAYGAYKAALDGASHAIGGAHEAARADEYVATKSHNYTLVTDTADQNAYIRAEYAALAAAYDGGWEALSRDASAIIAGRSVRELVSLPLWPNGAPSQARENLERLQETLSQPDGGWLPGFSSGPQQNGGWRVWFSWYDRRLLGVADREDIEFVFATIGAAERMAGARAANAWIAARLAEL